MPRKQHTDAAVLARFLEVRPQYSSDAAAHEALRVEFGYASVDGVRGKVLRARTKANASKTTERVKTPLPFVKTYVYKGEVPPAAVPVFKGAWHFKLDECVVAGDFHLPTAKLGFIEKMCQFADVNMKGKRTLLIVGDLHNGDKDSKHAKHIPPISRAQEIEFTRQTIDYLLGYFDEIKITPGNHMRNRLIEYLEGDVSLSQLTRLLTTQTNRVELSAYDMVHITSGGDKWVATHQYSYSKNKLVKANQLAQKYQCSVITFHQHHTAIGRDEFDRYTIVDCGGFHEQDMMGYVGLVPNTFPRMNNAFVFLREGTAHLLTPYRGMTDWRMWLPSVEQHAAAPTSAA